MVSNDFSEVEYLIIGHTSNKKQTIIGFSGKNIVKLIDIQMRANVLI